MNKYLKITLLGLVLFPIHHLSAQGFTLKATILTQERKPVGNALVKLLDEQKLFMQQLSDQDGVALLKVSKAGLFTLQTELIGYDNQSVLLKINQDTVVTILLTARSTVLNEVAVNAQKPLFERKLDRIIFNVENSLTAKGSSVFDVMNKAPGVQTSERAGISVNTKTAAIYLNDRQIRLSGDDLSNYLKSLSSDNISKIEIISNPPARYDAQGGAIINIITKKSTSDGLNSNLVTGFTQGQYRRVNESGTFNYRSGKLNLFGNYAFRTGMVAHDESEYIVFLPVSGTASRWENEKHGFRKSTSHTYELGLDYSVNKNHIIGFLIDGYNNASSRTNNIVTAIYNNYKTSVDSTLQTSNLSEGHIDQYAYNLNYKGKLDTSGKTLNIDLDYSPYRSNTGQLLNSITMLPNGLYNQNAPGQKNTSDQHIDIISGKVDFSNPFKKDWKFDAGLKYSRIENDNVYNNYFIINHLPKFDPAASNVFNYTESTSAAYGSLSGKIGALTFQIGLRGEFTYTSGYSKTLNTTNQATYSKLFPTIFLQYPSGKKNTVNFSYSKRISRPDYWRLNPFKYYSSPYTYIEGNPSLKPSITHSVELGYTINRKYSINAFFNQSNGYFSNITQQDNVSKVFFDTQRNLDKSIQTGLYSSVPVTVASWWDIYNYIRLAYKVEKSGYLQGTYDYHTVTTYISTTNSFTINKKQGLNAEITAWYSSPGIQGIYRIDKRYDLSAAVVKTMFNGNGSIRLNVSDIFNSNTYKIDVNYLDQQNGFREQNDTRVISLSISYKLGNQKIANARRRATSSQEEKNRAN